MDHNTNVGGRFMLYIGIDLGTSAVKLLLMDSEGNIRNIVSREYPLYFPHPGWSEQKPEDWYEQTMEGIRELLKDADKSQVAGISFGGQMHGLVILDEKDQVIRPAILWNDGRTTEECDYLNNVIGKEKLSEYTANISFTGFTAPKILWVKKNEPENFARIKKIMLPKDYIAYRLTGVHCTDVSDASGMLLFDVKNRCWSKEMCEICGVREEQLATCYESYEKVGCVLPEVADELGIPANVVVAAGTGVEVFATSLHYAPCGVDGQGFQVAIVLPQGTNYPLEGAHQKVEQGKAPSEDALLAATNKWLIGHAEGGLPEGSFLGLVGENLDVSK